MAQQLDPRVKRFQQIRAKRKEEAIFEQQIEKIKASLYKAGKDIPPDHVLRNVVRRRKDGFGR